MGFDVNLVQHDGYLEVIVTGSYDVQEAIDRFPHILSTCRLTGQCNVLMDGRDLESGPRATEKILYAFGIQGHYESYVASGGPPLKLAYLAAPAVVTHWEPALETAQDGNVPVGLFATKDEACEWLGVDPC